MLKTSVVRRLLRHGDCLFDGRHGFIFVIHPNMVAGKVQGSNLNLNTLAEIMHVPVETLDPTHTLESFNQFK